MPFAIAVLIGTCIYIALITLAAFTHHLKRFDTYVRLEVTALVVAIALLLSSAVAGDDWIILVIWSFTVAVQSFGVRQARKYRRYWQRWRDPHTLHVCNEDCPSWSSYGSART